MPGRAFHYELDESMGAGTYAGTLSAQSVRITRPFPAFKANGKIDGEILSTLVPCRSNRAQKLQPQNVRTSCTGKIACPGRPYQLVR